MRLVPALVGRGRAFWLVTEGGVAWGMVWRGERAWLGVRFSDGAGVRGGSPQEAAGRLWTAQPVRVRPVVARVQLAWLRKFHAGRALDEALARAGVTGLSGGRFARFAVNVFRVLV